MSRSEKPEKPLRPATMHDVARLAQVSQPTVSRVLNQTGAAISISEETRTRVLAAIKELNYRPNVLARSLRTQQTQMIAVLVADISNGFYHPIVRGIQNVASEHNFDVMIANSDHLYEHEKHFCEAVSRRPVDGIIMVPQHLTAEDLDELITRTHTPLVVLGQHIQHPLIDVIYAQDKQAVYQATRWLITDRGHTRLGVVAVPNDLPPGPRRLRGFMKALEDSGLEVQPEHVLIGDFTLEGGRTVAHQLLQCQQLPTALVVFNDLMAIGVLLELQKAGVRIPEDVAIVGYDDIPEARIVQPTLTTIAHDPLDIGVKMATCLFSRIANPTIPTRRIESLTRFIQRDSA